jgi:hypothetical protein
MSNYNGPSRRVRVRFKRDWSVMSPVKAGEYFDAWFYPELGTYYIGDPIYAHIGSHPLHRGLLEVVGDGEDPPQPAWLPAHLKLPDPCPTCGARFECAHDSHAGAPVKIGSADPLFFLGQRTDGEDELAHDGNPVVMCAKCNSLHRLFEPCVALPSAPAKEEA